MRITKNWNAMTQVQRIAIALLRETKGVDPLLAWTDYGTYRLGAVIHTLRHQWGVPITMERKVVIGRFGGSANVGNYEPADIAAAGRLYQRLHSEDCVALGLPVHWSEAA